MSAVVAMKWGVSLAQAGELAEPTTVARLAAQAEDVGWDGVFVWDHLWHRTGLPLADPWVTLATVALGARPPRPEDNHTSRAMPAIRPRATSSFFFMQAAPRC